ncbi:RHS repeat-associated core domain-containing protein [Blastococcus saxobsidens]|uniref:RHS repeat-associated core domain-containing protein n=1 Tax=Blastococcus saxobsidens TaxID=138336 RepID=UPI000CEC43F3|nr:RHS repeat-associated core domain-containing protein [Blastococcus saxobsidens]
MTKFSYAGGFDDPRSALVHFGQGWYDPTTGRFTQQDSLETLADPTRANRYEYAAGKPINYIYPTGLERCWVSSSNDSYWCRDKDDLLTGEGLDLTCPLIGLRVGLATLPFSAGWGLGLGFTADVVCDVYNK